MALRLKVAQRCLVHVLHTPRHVSAFQRPLSTNSSGSHGTFFNNDMKQAALKGLPIGVASGIMGSVMGVGGALLMVPLLAWTYSLRQIQCNATALVANAATCAAAALSFNTAGVVDTTAALTVALTGALTTPIGARFAHKLSNRTQKIIFAVGLIVFSPIVSLKPYIDSRIQKQLKEKAEAKAHTPSPTDSATSTIEASAHAADAQQQSSSSDILHRLPQLALIGTFVGWTSGALGFGAGTLLTTSLALSGGLEPPNRAPPGQSPSHVTSTSPTDATDAGKSDSVTLSGYTHHTVVGTSLMALILPNITGSIAHYKLGNIYMPLVPWLVVGSAVGGAVGSKLALGLEDSHLRYLFSAFLLFTGLKSFPK